MQIIRKSRRRLIVQIEWTFAWEHTPGAGFGFQLNPEGEIVQWGGLETDAYDANAPITRWGMAAQEPGGPWEDSLALCLAGKSETGERIFDEGIEVQERTYTEPAIGRCACGREVSLGGFTNTCDCGRDYNWNGDLLAPRSQWGEETGESLADIFSSYDPDEVPAY